MTLDEIKNNYALERNWSNWDDFLRNCILNACTGVLDQAIDDICILAQKRSVKKCDGCGNKFDAMDISVGVCYCCQKEIKQTAL